MAERAKAKVEVKPTEYVVLERMTLPATTGEREVWAEVGTTTSKAGVEKRIIAAVVGDREGTFKAVAMRAWKGAVKRAQTTIWKDEAIT